MEYVFILFGWLELIIGYRPPRGAEECAGRLPAKLTTVIRFGNS